MYLAVPSQPDCAAAWLAAAQQVNAMHAHEAHDVIFSVADPTKGASLGNPVVSLVNNFLEAREKSVSTIANTIFPQAIYERHGHPNFIRVFHQRVLPKVRKNERWSGYYFERMTAWPTGHDGSVDQLSGIVERMRDPKNRSKNKYELSLFDPKRDVDDSPYGGQCLSFLSFKLVTEADRRKLRLTAVYRNHYYTEKLLGNLIGLGRLMAFVAREADVEVGPLTIHSTHAEVDTVGATRAELSRLLDLCAAARGAASAA